MHHIEAAAIENRLQLLPGAFFIHGFEHDLGAAKARDVHRLRPYGEKGDEVSKFGKSACKRRNATRRSPLRHIQARYHKQYAHCRFSFWMELCGCNDKS